MYKYLGTFATQLCIECIPADISAWWMDLLQVARTTFFVSSLAAMLESVKNNKNDYTNCTDA
jgi:hypothetical protein